MTDRNVNDKSRESLFELLADLPLRALVHDSP